ncbi:MAG: bifunctional UDP-N-acetylglucosamine pyrophosphorylase/glucosamine-1-phosphate N-acetyltransferase [Myxococcota bacterium]|jgi:bifunctional UDP-N-acetylglucosamine pyrophosphorylase/glucosamine-1-phosphate N-acetyltransferase
MPRLVVHLPDGLEGLVVAGQSIGAHWEAVERSLPPGPGIVAVRGDWLRLAPATLAALGATLPSGASLVADGAVVAVARAEGDALELTGVRVEVPADERGAVVDAWDATLAGQAVLRHRVAGWARAGVRVIDPTGVWIGPDVVLESGCELWPGVVLRGTTRVAAGAVIRERVSLDDCTVAEGAIVLPGTVAEGASIGPGSRVGPMAHLRAGTVLERDNKVGNFVETKKARLEPGAKASHLTYLGDAHIGAGANIGAGTITCNYDGFGKHRTAIGEGAFIGSNTSLVAPVTVGKGAIVGAGSVIVQDVPADAIAVARGVQRVLAGRAPGLNARNRKAAAERGRK